MLKNSIQGGNVAVNTIILDERQVFIVLDLAGRSINQGCKCPQNQVLLRKH
ncbi:MAG: hypothetical protein Q4A11_04505 [Brachymonas sp.]|nr:hypothetical protein [Brachymonas sp.]